MAVSHTDVSKKKAVQRTIPRAGRSAPVPAGRQEQSEVGALSISRLPPVRHKPENEDIESVDLFLKTLGRILHGVYGRKRERLFLLPDEIEEVYMRTLINLNLKKRNFRLSSSWHDAVTGALERIPIALLAEKDPDHANDFPEISELLALEVYTRQYERTDPGGMTDAPLFDYHRGEFRQPDFVYRTGDNRVLRKYDPLQLSRDNSEEGMGQWLDGAYDKHAGGKGVGAVCILDVSTASIEQISAWCNIFDARLKQFPESVLPFQKPEQLPPKLIQLCNTYVVSYGSNAKSEEVGKFQKIFDDARAFLERHGGMHLLEEWRTNDVEPTAADDEGGFGDLLLGLFPDSDSFTTEQTDS